MLCQLHFLFPLKTKKLDTLNYFIVLLTKWRVERIYTWVTKYEIRMFLSYRSDFVHLSLFFLMLSRFRTETSKSSDLFIQNCRLQWNYLQIHTLILFFFLQFFLIELCNIYIIYLLSVSTQWGIGWRKQIKSQRLYNMILFILQ